MKKSLPESLQNSNSKNSNTKKARFPPYTNRGGNSEISLDFLSFTYSLEHLKTDEDKHKSLKDLLKMLGFSIAPNRTGRLGFKHSASIFQNKEVCGIVAWGGNQDRMLVSLTGKAFNYHSTSSIKNSFPPTLLKFLQEVKLKGTAKITRIDLAYDDLVGKYNLDFAQQSYDAGRMKISRQPSLSKWLGAGESGSTYYYGSRQAGKLLRVYEKGKQMKSQKFKDWMRWEVELRGKDREIPLEILENPDEYFAGAYPICSQILEKGGKRIEISRIKKEIRKENLVRNIKHQYGKHLDYLLREGIRIEELLRPDYEIQNQEHRTTEIVVLRVGRDIEELYRVEAKSEATSPSVLSP